MKKKKEEQPSSIDYFKQKGVIIHIHDIFLPYEYPKKWVKELKYFWNEAYLLQAFLMYNSAFEVLWAGNWMKTRYPEDCKKMFHLADGREIQGGIRIPLRLQL